MRDWIKPPCRASWPEPSQPNPCRAGKGPTPARTTRPAAIAVSSRSRGKATTAFDHHNNALPPANTFPPTFPFDQASLGPPVSPNIAHQALPDSVKPGRGLPTAVTATMRIISCTTPVGALPLSQRWEQQ